MPRIGALEDWNLPYSTHFWTAINPDGTPLLLEPMDLGVARIFFGFLILLVLTELQGRLDYLLPLFLLYGLLIFCRLWSLDLVLFLGGLCERAVGALGCTADPVKASLFCFLRFMTTTPIQGIVGGFCVWRYFF
jgi:hypothetical protein